MSADDRQDEASHFRRSPTGPRIAPPRQPIDRPAMQPPHRGGQKRRYWSVVIFILLVSGIGIRAYRDLSRPEAWAYWKESYLSPSMTSALIPNADFDGCGPWPACARNQRDNRCRQCQLVPGQARRDPSLRRRRRVAVFSGWRIESGRDHGRNHSIPWAGDRRRRHRRPGHVRPAYCASACVLVFAGGKIRYGVEGSMLGVHQFATTAPVRDPVADTQRVAGMLLGYMTKMGVSLRLSSKPCRDQGRTLARRPGSHGDEPRYRPDPKALSGAR